MATPSSSALSSSFDGEQLAELMIDHGVGVECGDVIEIVRVDSAFFEEG